MRDWQTYLLTGFALAILCVIVNPFVNEGVRFFTQEYVKLFVFVASFWCIAYVVKSVLVDRAR